MRTLASLLYPKVDEQEWKSVRDNEIWHLKQNEGDILPALRLSYNQLSFHLKQCFAYCSLFPNDYEFKSSLMVQFWIAHGLLQYMKKLCSIIPLECMILSMILLSQLPKVSVL